jgi:cellulose synthase/poly-beta-1,6-N-acetylglucosamine synthase-like glycosyltransferase
LIERNQYDLGADRCLAFKLLSKGFKTIYDPRAVAYTDCPDTVSNLIQQRRRWLNSAFVNQGVALLTRRLWTKPRLFLVMLFTLYEFIGAYLQPAMAIVVVHQIWTPFINVCNQTFGSQLDPTIIVLWWVAIQLVVMSSTKLITSDMFYVLNTFISGALMAASAWFFIRDVIFPLIDHIIEDPMGNWTAVVILGVFPLFHIIVSLSQPLLLPAAIFVYLMFPTTAITIPMYSFLRLDDFTWGTR